MTMTTREQHWVLADHLCSACGGRILKCVKGMGMTPGGNPQKLALVSSECQGIRLNPRS